MKMTIKDKVNDIIYTDRKNVNQTWCFKATEFKFSEMTSGHYISIQSFRDVFYSVANNAGSIFEKFMTKFHELPKQPSY